MTLRHLKIFVTVAECGKMRKAAELLYISQPTVSQAIAELESYYGIKLFERLSQKIYLTENGEQLLRYARHIINSFENMDLEMKRAGSKPRIRLGGSVSVGTRFFEHIMTRMEEVIPEIDMRIVINNTECIEKMILKSELDLGIVEGMVQDKDLKKEPIFTDELVIVAGKTHPFYEREMIQLQELENQNYIAREDGSLWRNQYDNLLAEQNIKLTKKWNSSNTEPIKKAVIAGKGISIISKLLVENEIKEGVLRIVPVQGVKVEREVQLIYHKDKFVSPQLNTLMEVARQITL